MKDAFDLERFVRAQTRVYEQATMELAAGRKRSHWMWFIFPQIKDLGFSPTARKYAISGAEEALAYIGHPLLGPRLRQCTELVLAIEGRSVHQIFGYPDDLKFRSSMTLFAKVSPDSPQFDAALVKYFDGEPDAKTLEFLQ